MERGKYFTQGMLLEYCTLLPRFINAALSFAGVDRPTDNDVYQDDD